MVAVPKFTYGTDSKYESGILGHDDVLKMGPILISTRPLLRTLIVQRFPYIFVDDAHPSAPRLLYDRKEAARQLSISVRASTT